MSGSSQPRFYWYWVSAHSGPWPWVAPSGIWTTFFGSGFEIAGRYNLPYLLTLYAITAIVYSLSVVIITFEMAYKIANTSWVQLAFSGAVIAGICLFHESLREVICPASPHGRASRRCRRTILSIAD
jgi:multidrug transporter EmrE-like cation transporter